MDSGPRRWGRFGAMQYDGRNLVLESFDKDRPAHLTIEAADIPEFLATLEWLRPPKPERPALERARIELERELGLADGTTYRMPPAVSQRIREHIACIDYALALEKR